MENLEIGNTKVRKCKLENVEVVMENLEIGNTKARNRSWNCKLEMYKVELKAERGCCNGKLRNWKRRS